MWFTRVPEPKTAGNCGVGGGYTDSSGHVQAFVVGEK